jgi:hypothetical protein
MPKFIPGLKLSKLFYQNEVKQILAEEFPRLRYSAAVIGWGSEVLGFDTAVSRDHHWGPRLLVFLRDRDYSRLKVPISRALSNNLPYEFMGYSTNYSKADPNGVRHPTRITRGPVNHMVNIYTVRSFFEARLGFDPSREITVTDWLTSPQQRLLALGRGEVYHDGLGKLEEVRERLRFYRGTFGYIYSLPNGPGFLKRKPLSAAPATSEMSWVPRWWLLGSCAR